MHINDCLWVVSGRKIKNRFPPSATINHQINASLFPNFHGSSSLISSLFFLTEGRRGENFISTPPFRPLTKNLLPSPLLSFMYLQSARLTKKAQCQIWENSQTKRTTSFFRAMDSNTKEIDIFVCVWCEWRKIMILLFALVDLVFLAPPSD